MANIYVKRGSVVEAEPFDLERAAEQAVTINPDTGAATMVLRGGRVVTVHPGDVLVTNDKGTFPCGGSTFPLMFQALEEVVTPDAISQTGGNQ